MRTIDFHLSGKSLRSRSCSQPCDRRLQLHGQAENSLPARSGIGGRSHATGSGLRDRSGATLLAVSPFSPASSGLSRLWRKRRHPTACPLSPLSPPHGCTHDEAGRQLPFGAGRGWWGGIGPLPPWQAETGQRWGESHPPLVFRRSMPGRIARDAVSWKVPTSRSSGDLAASVNRLAASSRRCAGPARDQPRPGPSRANVAG